MSMIERISAQLIVIEQKLKEILEVSGTAAQGKPEKGMHSNSSDSHSIDIDVVNEQTINVSPTDKIIPLHHDNIESTLSGNSSTAPPNNSNLSIPGHWTSQDSLEANIESLHKSIQRLSVLSEITNDVRGKYLLTEVVEATLDAIRRRTSLSFAVLILGERELGPYYYYGMRGEAAPWRHLLSECPFPLSGALAHAILRRRDDGEPDYLLYDDLTDNRPTSEEFPWLPDDGSLLFIPLRFAQQPIGVLMLGLPKGGYFSDETLCKDLYDISCISAEAIRTAQMYQDVSSNAEKLVNAQLLTREISLVQEYSDLITILTERLSEIAGKVSVNVYVQPSLHHLGDANHSPFSLPNSETKLQLVSSDSDDDGSNAPPSFVTNLLQWAINAGQPLFYDPSVVEDQSEHPLYNDTGPAMIVPIADAQRTYGALHLTALNPLRRFEESDMVVLRTITNSAATAFAKIQLESEKENSILSALLPMVEIVENRFPALRGHSERTAHNATLLARCMGLSDQVCKQVRIAASLHDIGIASRMDGDLEVAKFAAVGRLPLTTLRTLQSSQDILNRAGITPAITELVAQLGNYWKLTEADELTARFLRHNRSYSDTKEETLAFFFLNEMDEETQEIDSIASRRFHQNHRGYVLDADWTDASSSFSENHTSDTQTDPPPVQSSSSCKDGNSVRLEKPDELPRSQINSIAVQTIALAQTLDEFLIQTTSGRKERNGVTEAGLAKAFLTQEIHNPFDKRLTNELYSLVSQELVLLP